MEYCSIKGKSPCSSFRHGPPTFMKINGFLPGRKKFHAPHDATMLGPHAVCHPYTSGTLGTLFWSVHDLRPFGKASGFSTFHLSPILEKERRGDRENPGGLFLYPININYFRFVPLELESVKIRDYLRPHLPRSFFKGETDFCHRLIIK